MIADAKDATTDSSCGTNAVSKVFADHRDEL